MPRLKPLIAIFSSDIFYFFYKVHVSFNLQTSIKSSVLSLFIKARLKSIMMLNVEEKDNYFFINRQVKSPTNPHVLAGFLAFCKTSWI